MQLIIEVERGNTAPTVLAQDSQDGSSKYNTQQNSTDSIKQQNYANGSSMPKMKVQPGEHALGLMNARKRRPAQKSFDKTSKHTMNLHKLEGYYRAGMSAYQQQPAKVTIAQSVRNSYSLQNKPRYNESGYLSPKGGEPRPAPAMPYS